MALKFTRIIDEDDCIGDSLDTINSSFTALDIGIQDVQSQILTVRSEVEDIVYAQEYLGTWIKSPLKDTGGNNVGTGTTGYFLKYDHTDSQGFKWKPDTNIYSGSSLVGIGTSTPVAKLHIKGGSASQALRVDSDNSTSILAIAGTSGGSIRLTKAGLVDNPSGNPYLVEITSSLSGSTNVGGSINVLGSYFQINTGANQNNLSSLLVAVPVNGGRVGIGGITNPLAKLDIGSEGGTEGGEIRLRGSSSSTCDFTLDTTNDQFKILKYPKGLTTGYTTVLFASSNGYVGINTSTPKSSLDVSGSVTISDTVYSNQAVFNRNDTSREGGQITFRRSFDNGDAFAIDNYANGVGSADSRLRIYNMQTQSELVAVLSSGQVGFGTSTPATMLHIKTNSDRPSILTLESDANGDKISSGASENIHPGIVFKQDGGMSRGYVGYYGGTSDRDTSLHVRSDKEIVFATGAARNPGSLYTGVAYASATTAMFITSGGKVGIGYGINESTILTKESQLNNIDLKLYVEGDVWANNVRARSISASYLQVDSQFSSSLESEYVLVEDVLARVLYLSAGNAFAANKQGAKNYLNYTQTIAPYNLSGTYIAFGQSGSVNDLALLRQIGGTDQYHMALDLHDDPNGVNGQLFSIRNIDSTGTAQTRFHVNSYGNVGINTTIPTATLHVSGSSDVLPALQITQSIGGNALLIPDSVGSTGPFVVTNSGTVLKGLTSVLPGDGASQAIQASSSSYTGLGLASFGADSSYRGYLRFLKSRSTINGKLSSTNTGVKAGDALGAIDFYGDDNAGNTKPGAAIFSNVDYDWTSSSSPARLAFFTTMNGTSALSEKMRITGEGNVGINTTSPTSKLHVIDSSPRPAVRIKQTGNGYAFVVEDASSTSTPFVIDSLGNVGISESAPREQLEVNGGIIAKHINTYDKSQILRLASGIDTGRTGSSSNASASISIGGSLSSTSFFTNNTERARITNNGTLAILGTYQVPNDTFNETLVNTNGVPYGLWVQGDAYFGQEFQANNVIARGSFATNSLQNASNIIISNRDIKTGFYSSQDSQSLNINYDTLLSAAAPDGSPFRSYRPRDLVVYDGKKSPIITVYGATKRVIFAGDVIIQGTLSASNWSGTTQNTIISSTQTVVISSQTPTVSSYNVTNVTNVTNINGCPVGIISYLPFDVAPTGWLVCAGQRLINAKSVYPALYSALTPVTSAKPWGQSGNDVILPDLRSEFIRGWDGGRGVDPNRVFGSTQLDDIKSHVHSMLFEKEDTAGGDQPNTLYNVNPTDKRGTGFLTLSTNETGSVETRPRNVALLPCIKAFIDSEAIPQTTISLVTAVNSLQQAIQSKLETGSFTGSFSANGWQRLPSGLILQWGKSVVSADSKLTVTLPIAFPTALLSVALGGVQSSAIGGSVTIFWDSAASNKSSIVLGNDNTGRDGVASIVYYTAIGY